MVQGLDRASDRQGVLVGKSSAILLFNLKLMFPHTMSVFCMYQVIY